MRTDVGANTIWGWLPRHVFSVAAWQQGAERIGQGGFVMTMKCVKYINCIKY